MRKERQQEGPQLSNKPVPSLSPSSFPSEIPSRKPCLNPSLVPNI